MEDTEIPFLQNQKEIEDTMKDSNSMGRYVLKFTVEV